MKLTSYKLTQRGFTLLELIVAAAIFSIALLVATGLFVSVTRGQKRVQSLSKVQDDARFVLEQMAQAVRIDGIDYNYYLDRNGDGQVYPADLTEDNDISDAALSELVTNDASSVRRVFRQYTVAATGQNVIGVCSQNTLVSAENGRCKPGQEATAAFSIVTPTSINITDFKVWIDPGSDPFAPPPTSPSDCKSVNFDKPRGVCTCNDTADGSDDDTDATNCFPDQKCVTRVSSDICVNPNIQPRATLVISSTGGSARAEEQVTLTFQTTVSSRIYKR